MKEIVFILTTIIFIDQNVTIVFGLPLPQNYASSVVLVPPQVVLQPNQTEVDVICALRSPAQLDMATTSLKWILLSSFQNESSASFGQDDLGPTVIEDFTEVNECINVDVSNLTIIGNVAKLGLWIEVVSDECLDDLDEGRLYLRGICVAITAEAGMSSETFELNGLNSANFSSNDQNDACDSFYFGYHRKFWTGSERQRAKHKKDLFWMSGLIVAMAIPVAIGVFIVFHLTCLRNVGAAQANNMFGDGAGMFENTYMY